MRSAAAKIGAIFLFVFLGGCASGPKFNEMASNIPALHKTEGRIYVYRLDDFQGAAVQPEIRLNGEVIGRSIPGGFFYVDRKPGEYTVATSTEVERTTSFSLSAGETRYVKTSVSMGFLVGRVTPELQLPEQGRSSVSQLCYAPPR